MNEETGRPVALVTGAASGIGAATARRLADSGCDVLINYRSDLAGAEAVAKDCTQAGANAVVCQGDVAEDDDCRKLVEACVRELGRLDVLINNAGITKFASPHKLDLLDSEDFSRLTSVNVAGAYQMIRAAKPALQQSTCASIVNVSSHSGFSGIGSSIAYATTKGALNTMTLSFARALAPAIRVNAVCPGFVETPWHEKSEMLKGQRLKEFRESMRNTAPLNRITQAEDVAETICWLALGGKAVTGILLVVDGGTHLTIGRPT